MEDTGSHKFVCMDASLHHCKCTYEPSRPINVSFQGRSFSAQIVSDVISVHQHVSGGEGGHPSRPLLDSMLRTLSILGPHSSSLSGSAAYLWVCVGQLSICFPNNAYHQLFGIINTRVYFQYNTDMRWLPVSNPGDGGVLSTILVIDLWSFPCICITGYMLAIINEAKHVVIGTTHACYCMYKLPPDHNVVSVSAYQENSKDHSCLKRRRNKNWWRIWYILEQQGCMD